MSPRSTCVLLDPPFVARFVRSGTMPVRLPGSPEPGHTR